MSLTAHKINQRFHVSYSDITFGSRSLVDFLQTELEDIITTESLEPIEIEFTEDTIILRAQKIGHNTFIATNKRITGA